MVQHASAQSVDPWLPGWTYRKSVTINRAAGAGTDYQIKLTVNYGDPVGTSKFTNLVKYNGNPLNVPNGGGSGVVHPDVLYFPEGNDGYKYWMAYTPDPPDSLEHPSIARSNDGITWTSQGITNPVVSVETDADPAMVYVSDLNKWFMVWTIYSGPGTIGFAYSSDGKTWTKYDGTPVNGNANPTILSGQDSAGQAWERDSGGITKVTEPNLLYEDGIFYMHYATYVLGNNRGQVGLATFTWDNTNNRISNFQRNPGNPIVSLPADSQFASGQGHIDVSKSGSTYYMYTARASTSGGFRNCLLTSTDKINWNYYGMVLTTGATWEDTSIYRSCPVTDGIGNIVDFSGTMEFYYTGYHGSIPQIGLATGTDLPSSTLNGRCQADFGDVRFTGSDGQTLDYWLAEVTPGVQATFWVEVKDDLSTQDQVIYGYYGCSTPKSTTSDIKAASLWNQGDDFNDNSMDTAIWSSLQYSNGHPTETNQRLELNLGSLAGFISKDSHYMDNVEVSVIGHPASSSSVEIYLHNTQVTSAMITQAGGTNYDSLNVPTSYRMMMYGSTVYWQKNWVWGSTGTYGTSGCGATETLKMQVTGGTIKFLLGNSPFYSESWDSNVGRTCYVMIEGWGASTSSMSWADNLWIRKYVSSEPSVAFFGTEERVPTTVQSCDSSATPQNTFNPSDSIFVSGNGYDLTSTYNVYVVAHQQTWTDGMQFSARIGGTAASVISDGSGNIVPDLRSPVWASAMPGKYDIAIDVNGNGKYDAGIDALDNNDVVNNAGFFVVPEYLFGGLAALGACFAALALVKRKSLPHVRIRS